jgi:PAS domain S-box-containing protein
MAEPLHESLGKTVAHDHIALFYRNRKEMLAASVLFLQAGLSRGDKCLIHCGRAQDEDILAGLRQGGLDVGEALTRGALLVIRTRKGSGEPGPADIEELVAVLDTLVRQAQAEKYRVLRICTDLSFPANGRKAPERRPGIRACEAFHAFLKNREAAALCLYGMKELPPAVLLDALAWHPYVIFKGRMLDNLHFRPAPSGRDDRDLMQNLSRQLARLAARQEQLSRANRQAIRLKRFQDTMGCLLAHADLQDLLRGIVEGVIALGYRMCWIGMARPDGSVEPVASWGDRRGYLKGLVMRWDDTPPGKGPVGVAIRTGRPDIIRNVTRSRRFAPWREHAMAEGFCSVAAFPLRDDGTAVGALAVYAPDPSAFDRDGVEELEAFALQASLILRHVEARRALAESEEKFRTVVEDANMLVVELDPEGRIRLFNRAAEALTGYRAEEVAGKDCIALLVPERERARVAGEFRRILEGKDAEGLPVTILTRSGEERIVSWNGRALHDATGRLRGLVGLCADITERRRMEAERHRLQTALARAQKMEALGSLAGGVAHEFNNVLGPIMGYTSLLLARMGRNDPFLDMVEKIHRSARRAGELTEQLLGFARGGQHEIAPVSLNEIVRRVLSVVSRTVGPKIEIRTVLDPSLPDVEGNAGQLEQSLLNLFRNARDAMPDGGVLTITTGSARLSAREAKTYHVGRPGDYSFIEVRDTGMGMTDEVRQRIFEPFFSTRRTRERTGLGLAMVYGVVKSHSGGIHVDSAPGRGSAFRIFLPAEPYPRGSETILVVDDEPAVRDMCEALLSALGYRAILAEDGEAACRVYRERGREVDLVLLDLVMPRMGGRETFRALRAMDPGVRVLLSSGYARQGEAQEILDGGARGFLQKPYGISELARTVRGILDADREATYQRETGA